ncbi:MAG: hypothetical protein V4724_39720 [Pseudomonadota bacterium]
MEAFRQLVAVPAYIACDESWRSAPFIVSLAMCDRRGRPRLVPAVEAAVDRVVDIVGAIGLVTVNIKDNSDLAAHHDLLRRALSFASAVTLFQCSSVEAGEQLMTFLHQRYRLELVREAAS